MYKRKKKKITPKPTPPAPPTSGSNAFKPYYCHQDFTSGTPCLNFADGICRGGTLATCKHKHTTPVKPPKKPCPYETPCGWCSKWDKKCDKKPYKRGLRIKINPVDDAWNTPKEN